MGYIWESHVFCFVFVYFLCFVVCFVFCLVVVSRILYFACSDYYYVLLTVLIFCVTI